MPSEDKSYIEELKKSLYSRTAPDVRTRRKLRFAEEITNVPKNWAPPPEEDANVQLNQKYKNPNMSFFTKLFIVSALFCIGAVGLGAYIFFNGGNLISADNIEINISGPVSIPGGEPVALDISIVNKNNVALNLVDMSVDFPAGATDPSNTGQVLQNYRKLIGDIPVGGKAKETVQAVIFGEENAQKEVEVSLTYRVKGSTSVFTKKQKYEMLINSSPIGLTVSSFKEIASGQEFDLKIDIKSNSQQVLKNVLLKADYPFGYTYMSSNVQPFVGNSMWKIGDVPPASSRTLVIHGRLNGEDTDLRAFRFTIGAQSANDPKVIGTQYMMAENSVTIQKPFISAAIIIDGDESSADHVARFEDNERVEIRWFNNLPSAVSNMQIVAKLSGSAYDKNYVQPGSGIFNSAKGEIVWNQQTNSEFESVSAGESGVVSFFIKAKRPSDNSANPNLTTAVTVAGNRVQESRVPESLRSVVTRNTRIQPSTSLSGRVVRTSGPFANSGPIPPRSEQTTTYTIIWNVENSSNSIVNGEVTAALPAYVKWLNAVSPSSENVAYDANRGVITWKIGNSYTSDSGRREVAFQVSVTPSVNQIGQSLTLVNEATLTATDNYTGTTLTSEQEVLSTRFSTDPSYKEGDQKVIQ